MPQVQTHPTTCPPNEASGQSMNSKLIMPFMAAVLDVFQKMAGVKTTIGKPFIKTEAGSAYEVCGIIGFSGEITGSVVLSFSDSAAEKLVEAFAGVSMKRSDPDFADAVGELANMVAGSAKKGLGALASISVPSVVIGKGFSIALTHAYPCLVIPCGSPFGDFAVEVSIKRNPAN
jgi:chemotaxis protein CheX